MNRRNASAGLLVALVAIGVVPRVALAQQADRMYRLGYLSQPSRESVEPVLREFLEALRKLGWVEGQNLSIEYRWAEGKVERLPELAAELVRSKVDLIVAPAATAVLAAKNATSTIPIVMIFPADPVGLGLVASLGRPGGNVTGTTYSHGPEIFRKQLQILKETVPQATRIAILGSPADPLRALQRRELDAAARSMGLRLYYVEARGPEDFDGAFAAIERERAEALLIAGSSAYLVHRSRLAEFVTRGRLPTMFTLREMMEAGGLLAYAANLTDFVGRSAGYVDKILKGASPADLPVEQPTKFDLTINLKVARMLGLTVPTSILQRADELIQ